MAKKRTKKQIAQYEHSKSERANNPHVGLVTPASDPDTGEKKTYQYDPHLDPQLQWAGKAEHTSFEVPTVSLHVHERIDPKTIIETVKKEKDDGGQMSLFSEKKPLREAIDFYKHKEGWTNRLIAGDSLLVMNSLLEKEGMAGKVQMVYFDPPYGIKYGSNFMPFVNKKEVKDGADNDLTAEPEMLKAFRDTWELGIHSYLTYIRDRMKLANRLLADEGSVYVQIGDENVHRVSLVMDEVFGAENRIATISFATTSGSSSNFIPQVSDYILWYAKDKNKCKYRQLYENLSRREIIEFFSSYVMVELENGDTRKLTDLERFDPDKHLPKGARIYRRTGLDSQGASTTGRSEPFDWNGKTYPCAKGRHWSISYDGMNRLSELKRLDAAKNGNALMWKKYENEVPGRRINNLWPSQMYATDKDYVVQTAILPIQRCILMSTDPGDLALDITCGSGTTAAVAEQWGRRWITCDTSRVALTLAKQRLLTANFDYYELAHRSEGVSSGFKYKTISKVTPKILGENQPPTIVSLFDEAETIRSKTRITGPFTVEAVPAPYAKSFDELELNNQGSDTSISRSGETNRQAEWRDELLRTGVRAKAGKIIDFIRVEPLMGTKFIQAEAETKEDIPKKVLVIFGPEHAPMEQRMVENAWQEARALKPDILLFCAFQFDEEAAKDIDELTPYIAGMQLLKAQMNADMLTDDLRKKRSSNESFWLVGQPDVQLHKLEDGKVTIEVMGFDYYNPKTGNVESGGKKNIAMWMLDTDYDNRSLFPSQVFFPMAGAKDGWAKLAKNLKAEIDEEKIEAFRGTLSLPFEPGPAVAVKIIDDRGIESLRVLTV
ncbi:site-specific DNA-methyltransferase [Pricia sp. S334]|uniref:Site-specific DNA-methyltransferase n=1 Tax=Pricia mediterranea TaxID=3076079 RepID=A0ABU3L5N2_9FLAO|nr:site-specific DNA-methyltransferase [Pricia sp. S334]MDT7828858.1 site-specific DNA-methyltransferase [Pricia sp. S334]